MVPGAEPVLGQAAGVRVVECVPCQRPLQCVTALYSSSGPSWTGYAFGSSGSDQMRMSSQRSRAQAMHCSRVPSNLPSTLTESFQYAFQFFLWGR